MDKPKYKIGEKYVIVIKSRREVEVLRELNTIDNVLNYSASMLLNTLKVTSILGSLIFPPLLFVTIPFIYVRRKNA